MTTSFQMKFAILCILSKIAVLTADADQRNEAIIEEIEAVASESRSLANELADMLSVLEVADLREEAVEFAVIGDNAKVQSVLKAMVDRIKKLENNSKDNTPYTLTNKTILQKGDEEINSIPNLRTKKRDYITH